MAKSLKNLALLAGAGAAFFINSCLNNSAYSQNQVSKTDQSQIAVSDSLPKPAYFGFAKELLDMEKQAGFPVQESNYKTLDSLINKIKGHINSSEKPVDAKKEAINNFSVIDVFLKEKKDASVRNLLLSESLNSKNFNSLHYLVLYLDIASRKNISLIPMKAGENIFAKYNFQNSSWLNWETSFGIEQKDEFYKKLMKNLEIQEIKEISKDELLAMEFRNIGLAFNGNKEYKKAIEYFDRAAVLNSEDYRAYKYQGDSWFALGDFNKAVENYNLAIGLNSQFAEAYLARANLYYKEKNFGWALKDYGKAIALGIENPEIYKIRAELLIKLDENKGSIWDERKIPEQAKNDYLKALELIQQGR